MKRLNQKGSGEGSAIIVIFILICALIVAMMQSVIYGPPEANLPVLEAARLNR